MTKRKSAVILAMMGLLVVLLVLGPLFTIWSLNVLFRLNITYDFRAWCAIAWLLTVLYGSRFVVSREQE